MIVTWNIGKSNVFRSQWKKVNNIMLCNGKCEFWLMLLLPQLGLQNIW